MQILLSHAAAIPPLLEARQTDTASVRSIQAGFSKVLSTLQTWEDCFVADAMLYQLVDPDHFNLPAKPQLLPDPCFAFLDVSHANSLTHCWGFRIVCLLQLSKFETSLAGDGVHISEVQHNRHAEVEDLCYKICRGLPFLLRKT